ncbi:MAG: succinate dehydrogenase, cytochrome b556 subunit [Candidatus Malihini olakiniferum]
MEKYFKKQIYINIDLQKIRFPLTAIVSILHRISVVIIFVAVGILLWLLRHFLSSEEGFLYAAAILDSVIVKFILWSIFTALAYYIVGGLRYLMMDFVFLEEDLASGNYSATFSSIITVVLSLLAGVLVW